MKKVLKYILYLIVINISIIAISSIISYYTLDINSYNVESNKINNNYKIMLLSDLHGRNSKDKITTIVKKEKPNLIVMSGDMINEKDTIHKEFFDLCKSLEKEKIYYVFGNHEENMTNENKNKFIKEINNTNINLINNKIIKLDENINLYGFNPNIELYNNYDLDNSTLNNVFGELNKDDFNILIAHNPLEYESYSNYGFDLTLSGHIHGGIIKLPFLGALLSPDFTFFPKYFEGINRIDNMDLVISRGLGYGNMLKIRVFNTPEIVIVNLHKNN